MIKESCTRLQNPEGRISHRPGTLAEADANAARGPEPSSDRGHSVSDAGRPAVATEPARRVMAPIGAANTRMGLATQREALFTTVRVEPGFSPQAFAATFAALLATPSAKLLDLTPARMISADIFERLAEAWTAPVEAVPRLGIVLSFERWVMLRKIAIAALQPLAARGIKVEIFYDEQAWGVRLKAWFAYGQLVHNLPAVVATLNLRWQPSALWPMVIDTLSRLVRAHTDPAELPTLLTEVSGLARSCGGAEQAATLAREALSHLPEAPSATRNKALHELGAALMDQWQTAAERAVPEWPVSLQPCGLPGCRAAVSSCDRATVLTNPTTTPPRLGASQLGGRPDAPRQRRRGLPHEDRAGAATAAAIALPAPEGPPPAVEAARRDTH